MLTGLNRWGGNVQFTSQPKTQFLYGKDTNDRAIAVELPVDQANNSTVLAPLLVPVYKNIFGERTAIVGNGSYVRLFPQAQTPHEIKDSFDTRKHDLNGGSAGLLF